jgi:beta-lactamase class A
LIALTLLMTACGGSGNGAPKPTATPTTTPTPVVPPNPPATATSAAPPTAAVTSTPVPTVSVDPKLPLAIAKLLKNQDGVFGILLMHPNGAVEYQLNADTPFIAASLYKLVLLANIFEKREHGELSFDQDVELLPEYFPEPGDFVDSFYDRTTVGSTPSIDDLVFATASYSSNVAAKALLSLTDTASLDRTTLALGLEDTYLFIDPSAVTDWVSATATATSSNVGEAVAFVDRLAKEGPVNITTPRDMCRYFQLLLDGKVIDPAVSAEILALLKKQAIDTAFPKFLPGVEMAHKTGNLDHVVHDVGIIWTPTGPVILAAMIEDPPNDDHATQIIQRLALIAYGTYDVPPFTAHAVDETSPVPDSPDGSAPSDQDSADG